LQSQTNCETGGAEYGQETGGLNAELLQCRKDGKDDDAVSYEVGEKPLKRNVHFFGRARAFPVARPAHPAAIHPMMRIATAPTISIP